MRLVNFGVTSGGGGGATALSGLSDVTLAALAGGQVLQYNAVSGDWENTAISITGGLEYKGVFDASTGLPSIATASQGDYYKISVSGTLYGRVWAVEDSLLVNADMGGSITNGKIDKIDSTDAVASVNGKTGTVVIYTDDITALAGNALSVSGAGATSALDVATASETVEGVIEISTNAEATTGTATDKVLVPSNIGSIGTSQLNNDASFIAAAGAPVQSVNSATGTVSLGLDDLDNVTYTPGAGIDNYVLTYDDGSSSWGAEAASGGGGATRPTVTPVSFVAPVITYAIAAPTGATELEHIYLVDNVAVAVEVDLPTAAGISGFKLQIKRLGTATVSIDPNLLEQIDNGGAGVVFDLISQYASVTLVSNGTNWLII